MQLATLSSTLGLAWTVTRNAKTVLRLGAGRDFDAAASANSANLLAERRELLPVGTTRIAVRGSSITNDDGQVLDFPQQTSFRVSQLLAFLHQLQAQLAATQYPGDHY